MAKISIFLFTLCFAFVFSTNESNDLVRIFNSGSTNTAAYTIELQRNGLVKWSVASRFRPLLSTTPSSSTASSQNSVQLSSRQTANLFQTIDNAFPFSQTSPVSCMKSISFGTSLRLSYKGQQTPDLNCPMQVKELAVLSETIHQLINTLHIQTMRSINE